MANQITVHIDTGGMCVSELRKCSQALDRLQIMVRDAEIRARYQDLKPKMTQTEAIAQIAQEYDLSESTVNRILWPR